MTRYLLQTFTHFTPFVYFDFVIAHTFGFNAFESDVEKLAAGRGIVVDLLICLERVVGHAGPCKGSSDLVACESPCIPNGTFP